jgi:hypothetical protein
MIEHQLVEHGKLCARLRSAVGGDIGVISVCRCDHAPNPVCGSSTAYAWSQQPQHYSRALMQIQQPVTRSHHHFGTNAHWAVESQSSTVSPWSMPSIRFSRNV